MGRHQLEYMYSPGIQIVHPQIVHDRQIVHFFSKIYVTAKLCTFFQADVLANDLQIVHIFQTNVLQNDFKSVHLFHLSGLSDKLISCFYFQTTT